MSSEIITVSHPEISRAEADVVNRYFIAPCNDPERPKLTFTGAKADYDEDTKTMTVEVKLSPTATPDIGRTAIEDAFRFAEDITTLAS